MSSSVAQDPSSRVVTRARIGFRAQVTYFELGCPETNIDPAIVYQTHRPVALNRNFCRCIKIEKIHYLYTQMRSRNNCVREK